MSSEVQWTMAYAVLRSPRGLVPGVDLNIQIKVVSVWPNEQLAESETGRLQGLAKGDEHYWWQSTHLHTAERGET